MYKSYVVFLFRFFIYLTTLRKLILPNLQNSKIPINYIITAPLISIKKKKSIFVSISPRNKIIKNSNDKSSFIESSNHWNRIRPVAIGIGRNRERENRVAIMHRERMNGGRCICTCNNMMQPTEGPLESRDSGGAA